MPLGRPIVSPEVRFFRLVSQQGDCWLWTGTKNNGYGAFSLPSKQRIYAHRWSYQFFIADIPMGLELDHLCVTRSCVNPWHLEPVTRQVNALRSSSPASLNARKTRCANGHEFTDANMVIVSKGRACRTCQRTYDREYKRRIRKVAV